jgi:hypothetical protein
MGLMDTIRKTEERSRAAARRGLQKAKAGWEDTERALRRKMRIYPDSKAAPVNNANVMSRSEAGVSNISERDSDRIASDDMKRAIVSVNGKDLEATHAERKVA